MSLSSNELFHFTKVDYLKGILKEKGFFPRYNAEFVHFTKSSAQQAALWAVPMVCFCDIPYELSDLHRERYGNVGIVMSEEWKLNPVIYLQSESHLANSLSNLAALDEVFYNISTQSSHDKLIMDGINSASFNLNHLSYFLKQFENKKNVEVTYGDSTYFFEKRRFYDEREWRYIPFDFEIFGKRYVHISIEEYGDQEKLEIANNLMMDYKLGFELSDIEYIVVESENDKSDIKNLVQDLFSFEIEIRIS